MTLNRNLNTWLLLLAITVMVNRLLTPFLVPPLVVHDNGYIEVCSWQGGSERLLLDSNGQQIESEQPFSHCPDCASGTALLAQNVAAGLQELPPARNPVLVIGSLAPLSPTHLLPPTRAPPLIQA
ncbi:hypothetical protein [Marinospirillum perlucidum]|uniref:hypothetical protein n=1 Tax=Marinospirillum perlucidum TaxID=1982602 RepID=UPI000DF190A6|nr:hypothetical protein [Marinospirillum perlucidum]